MPTAPHNVEAEQQLLGAILTDNRVTEKIGDIEPEHFFDPVHQRIAKAIFDRLRDGRLASPVTLKSDLDHDAGLRELGGAAYLVRMAGAAISAHAVPDYAREVRELWGRRRLLDTLAEGIERIRRGGAAVATAAKVEGDLADIQRVSAARPLSSSFLKASFDAAQQVAAAYHSGDGLAGISTGITALDNLIGGLEKGRLYVLGGRPAMGKTAVAGNIAATVAMRGEPVFFASLEMPAKDLALRFYAQALAQKGIRIPYSDMGKGRMDEHEFRALIETMKAHENLPLEIGEIDTKEIGKLRAALRRAKAAAEPKGGLRLVVVDYIQRLNVEGQQRNIDVVSAASRFLKDVAMEFEVPVLALSQLSRGVETRENKRPMLSDLRESGQIEQDADTVLFAYRPAYYLLNEVQFAATAEARLNAQVELDRVGNDLEIIVAKQRSGRADVVRVEIDLPTNTIRNKNDQRGMDL